jgi:putative nucleotidyltransferase with HDIG domain
MTVPSRREAARLLLSLQPPPWHLRHACAVADVAAFLARRAAALGSSIDVLAVETAALLHDVDKLRTAGTPAHLRHGEGSAAWLEAHGLGELAPLVRDHPVTRLADEAEAEATARVELGARIVAYADKRAGQELESMDDRFASWNRRYPDSWDEAVLTKITDRARNLEREVCVAAGVSPEQVRRLRWSRRALREAAR